MSEHRWQAYPLGSAVLAPVRYKLDGLRRRNPCGLQDMRCRRVSDDPRGRNAGLGVCISSSDNNSFHRRHFLHRSIYESEAVRTAFAFRPLIEVDDYAGLLSTSISYSRGAFEAEHVSVENLGRHCIRQQTPLDTCCTHGSF